MEIVGRLHIKYDTEQVSATFKKRRFVVEHAENPLYPQLIELQLSQDKVLDIDKFKLGDAITVAFNLRGREWRNPQTNEMKYFNTLEAWRLQPVPVPKNSGATNPNAYQQNSAMHLVGSSSHTATYAAPPPPQIQRKEDEDLPF